MKYLVTIPIIGYAEYYVETDEESINEVRSMVLNGELDLEQKPHSSTSVEEFILVSTVLEHPELPEDWPTSFEVVPY